MRFLCLLAMLASALLAQLASAAPSPWEQPAAALADQIAGILGPGQARLTMRNLSKISMDEFPAIRSLLEQDLKARGVQTSGAESANSIRVTLSENLRERLWVAEVVEGSETRVAIVHVEAGAAQPEALAGGLALRRQSLLTTTEPVLAALETGDGLVVVGPEEIVVFAHSANGWKEQNRVAIGQRKPLPRDPRSVIVLSPDGLGFEALVAGMACSGSKQPAQPEAQWTVRCRESDDPWQLTQSQRLAASSDHAENAGLTRIRAFFSTARNYFTGVVTPSVGVDLPPFYSAALLPRPDGAGLLINSIDGKVQIAETATLKLGVPTDGSSSVGLKAIAGTRDWGSDFAAFRSGCSTGTQVIASGSGEAFADSLRAYEIPAQEAIPASAPMNMDGTVTALGTAPDGKSVLAVVRRTGSQGHADSYEVDRVTASCN
jgi:hypothetical protein